jgi:hypothetical protein
MRNYKQKFVLFSLAKWTECISRVRIDQSTLFNDDSTRKSSTCITNYQNDDDDIFYTTLH